MSTFDFFNSIFYGTQLSNEENLRKKVLKHWPHAGLTEKFNSGYGEYFTLI
jgi:hypothetical protein